MMTVTVEKGSEAQGKRLSELEIPKTSVILAIYEGDSLILPTGDLIISEGQKVVFLGPSKDSDILQSTFLK